MKAKEKGIREDEMFGWHRGINGREFQQAPECQVLDNVNHPDAMLGKDGNRQSSSLYDMIPAKPQNSNPAEEWNKVRIMVYKGTVVHTQNGENVVEYHLWTPQWTDMLQASKFSAERWPMGFELLNNCGGENLYTDVTIPNIITMVLNTDITLTVLTTAVVKDHGDDVWYRNIRVKVLE